MDPVIRKILITIQCEDLIPVFEDHEIDTERRAYLLGEGELKELIPKIGPRLKLKKLIKQLKQEANEREPSSDIPVTYADNYIVVSQDSPAETGSSSPQEALTGLRYQA